MGRVFDTLHVGKERLYTLFDSGAKHCFISEAAAGCGSVTKLKGPLPVEIGGRRHRLGKLCSLEGTLRRKMVVITALVLPEIGSDAEGRPIDVIFGADAMQDFRIRLIPEEERVDLSHFSRTFVEF
ncbi:MAG: hypothetical protein HYZ53_24630 [Planctomycetes bacterium]|nr:hypothetical protein [Planctomycetota bacterium]